MPRELFIMRHAHAKSSQGEGDFSRELKDKGKRNAQRMGVWLAQNKLLPDCIQTSPAVRAKTTAHKLIKSAGRKASTVKDNDKLYHGSAKDVMKVISKVPSKVKRLMIVGHNPGLADLLTLLCEEKLPRNSKGKLLPPATLVRLELDCHWRDISLDCARLKEVVYSKDLPEFFPYAGANGDEERVRPAYYYSQSCVVPFRENGAGELEVLIVSSSSRKHWVMPKGIHDPGLSAQASAAQEAFEEAGAMGEVLLDELGRYEYEKWDATCTVKVYPMRVGGLLKKDKWEESHRLRKWVSLSEAQELIENKDLALIAAELPKYLKRGM